MSNNAFWYNPTEYTLEAAGYGVRMPTYTTAARIALSSLLGVDDEGLVVRDTTLNNHFTWNGTGWTSGMGSVAFGNGSTGITSNINIGTSLNSASLTGTNDIAIGNTALNVLTTGSNNIAIGNSALASVLTGVGNVAVGRLSLGATTGSNNTALGEQAGTATTSGQSNVFIGGNAGANNTTGGSNICIGFNSQLATAGASNVIAIGSSTNFVGTNGGATTWFGTATAGSIAPTNFVGFIRIYWNGTFIKIPMYND